MPYGCADRAGGARYDDGVAFLWRADIEQAEISGHARHAERVEKRRQRRKTGIDFHELSAVERCVFLNTEPAADIVAGGKFWVLRRNDLADRARPHDVAYGHRRNVGSSLVHPAAHRRIEREIQNPRKHFAIARFRQRRLCEFPIAPLR